MQSCQAASETELAFISADACGRMSDPSLEATPEIKRAVPTRVLIPVPRLTCHSRTQADQNVCHANFSSCDDN